MNAPRLLKIAASLYCSFLTIAGGAPAKFESLTTTRNRTYNKVEVREITPGGIKIFHESGAATIPFEELPEEIQAQLGGFDPVAAEKHRKEVNEALRRQETAIDTQLGQQNAKPATKPAAKPAASPATPSIGVIQGDPFGAPDPSPAKPAPSSAPPSSTQSVVPEKGVLSARIIGYRSGVKRVEFKARTNCEAKLEVHQVAPDEHSSMPHTDTFDVPRNIEFVRQIWVYNNYSSDLYAKSGKRLDSESNRTKTHTGGLARPSLR